jgi:hypothetical protein
MKKTYGEYRGLGNPSAIPPDFFLNSKDRRKGEDLNHILGNILQDLKGERNPSVIRCDELPFVHESGDKMANTFQYILNFILSNPPRGATLFLYIKCEIAKTEFIDLSLNSFDKLYRISFHTNSEANTKDFPEELQKYCSDSLTEMKGKFSINTEPGTGWLFNLEVPGKLK